MVNMQTNLASRNDRSTQPQTEMLSQNGIVVKIFHGLSIKWPQNESQKISTSRKWQGSL